MPLIFQSGAQGFSRSAFSGCRAIPPQPLRDIKHPELLPQPAKCRFFFCQPGSAQHLSICLKGPPEGCSGAAGCWGEAQSCHSPPHVPSSQLQCPPSPWMRLSHCPAAIPASLGPSTENSKSLGSTLGFAHRGVGGEPKSVRLCLQQCLGGWMRPLGWSWDGGGLSLGSFPWIVQKFWCGVVSGRCSGHPMSPNTRNRSTIPALPTPARLSQFSSWCFGSFLSNKFICHPKYKLLTYHWLGRRGELPLDPSSPSLDVVGSRWDLPMDLSFPATRCCSLMRRCCLILRSGAALDHKLKALSILGDIKKRKKKG